MWETKRGKWQIVREEKEKLRENKEGRVRKGRGSPNKQKPITLTLAPSIASAPSTAVGTSANVFVKLYFVV